MAVTRADVEHIAQLARLAIDETKLPQLTEQLNGILAHIDVLQRVDTSKTSPVAGIGDAGMRLRADEIRPIPLARPREAFAPSMRDGFFLVPRLATHEGLAAGAAADDEDAE